MQPTNPGALNFDKDQHFSTWAHVDFPMYFIFKINEQICLLFVYKYAAL